MNILLLILIPFILGITILFLKNIFIRRLFLIIVSSSHLVLTVYSWFIESGHVFYDLFFLDKLGILFLNVTSILFFMTSIYEVFYLKGQTKELKIDSEESFMFFNMNENVFIALMCFFLGTMTLVITSQNFGMLWVAIEATTLTSAPLIFFHKHHRSLEALWKYLIICSVGIALALLGNFLLAISFKGEGNTNIPFFINQLLNKNLVVDNFWLKGAFIFLFVGYGTKMGLAPMHTWLPDAHSESPSVISALFSGALLNCAFLAILRIYQVCNFHGIGSFCRELFLIFGIFSILFAAIFIINQKDYKRMLAYSSVEHMGILIFGIGLGGNAVFGSLLHLINHSFTKGMLFLTSGIILEKYKTKNISKVTGILRSFPSVAFLWIAGFFAIVGTPPFGSFISKFIILKTAFENGHVILGVFFLMLLLFVFIGMANIFFKMSLGNSDMELEDNKKEFVGFLIPSFMLLVLILILGVYLPKFLETFLREVSMYLINN